MLMITLDQIIEKHPELTRKNKLDTFYILEWFLLIIT